MAEHLPAIHVHVKNEPSQQLEPISLQPHTNEINDTKKQAKKLINKRDGLREELIEVKRKRIKSDKRAEDIVETQKFLWKLFEVIAFMILVALIIVFAWDPLEQWTFVVAGAIVVLRFCYAFVVYGRTDLNDGFETRLKMEKEKQYRNNKYNADNEKEIKKELDEVIAKLKEFWGN